MPVAKSQTQQTVGHEAFSSASLWLANVAREGKRVGDRQTAEPVVYRGHVPLAAIRFRQRT